MKASKFRAPTITVNLTQTLGVDGDGKSVTRQFPPVRMRVLTIHEWWEVGTRVADVPVPKDKSGKQIPDDMKYRSDKLAADNLRAVYRLATALDTPDCGIEFEGKTLEDRVDELQEFDPAVILNLYWELEKKARGGQVSVATDAFRPDGS